MRLRARDARESMRLTWRTECEGSAPAGEEAPEPVREHVDAQVGREDQSEADVQLVEGAAARTRRVLGFEDVYDEVLVRKKLDNLRSVLKGSSS